LLLTTTQVAASGDTVNRTCSGTPVGGGIGAVSYALTATAQATSTGSDVGIATGVTCCIWDAAHGFRLSDAISVSASGPSSRAAALTSATDWSLNVSWLR